MKFPLILQGSMASELFPWLAFFAILAFVIYVADQRSKRKSPISVKVHNDAEKVAISPDPFHITPLQNLDWRTTAPLKFRNFKPKYHLTMGLTNTTFSDFTVMDCNYLDRMTQRTNVIREHHDIVIQSVPEVLPAAQELYSWVVNSYLPIRFPSMFRTVSSSETDQRAPHILNTATGQSMPSVPPTDVTELFELLGRNIDEDFLLLLPSEDGDGYVLKGYVVCNPSGFNTKEKFGLKLRDIHGPVPGYKQKLEKSMDRFFDRLEVGKIVLRSNWMIQTHTNLYAASEANHLYDETSIPKDEVIDISKTHLRCERQTLHRLPRTRALVFKFKTYLYPLAQLKEEGYGEELAQAVDGLREGSVPGMWLYKRGVVWGETVKEFLRS